MKLKPSDEEEDNEDGDDDEDDDNDDDDDDDDSSSGGICSALKLFSITNKLYKINNNNYTIR